MSLTNHVLSNQADIKVTIKKNLLKEAEIPSVCHGYNATNHQNLLKLRKLLRNSSIEADENIKMTHWRRHGLLTEKELGGKFRFSADGFADLQECQVLLDLSLMVESNEVDASVMELFMEICDRGKNMTERYFGQEGKFHFAFSQIACRTGIPEKTNGTRWMSHKIHADNCQLQPSGECLKEEPAYTSNDYSAIIYLNDNFEGGEFIFSEDPLGEVIQSTITPKCGRMVGFTAGPENKHGVRGVTKGTRCALGLWFTKDPAHTERKPFLIETIREIRSRPKRN